MKNLIQNELAASKKIDFERDKKKLIKLNQKNVAFAEAMISHNSSYNKALNKECKSEGKYKGSTAHWIDVLSKDYNKNNLEEAVCAINRDNSTRASNADCKSIAKYLIENFTSIGSLKQTLKERDKGIALVEKLRDKNIAKTKKNCYSLASNILHYLCYCMFKGKQEQDNYPIYDSITNKSIGEYIKHYKLKDIKTTKYSDYCDVIDKVIKKSGSKISRNGFDHILWYSNK